MLISQKREVRQIMSNYVGIVRSNLSLKRAMRRLSSSSKRPKSSTARPSPTASCA